MYEPRHSVVGFSFGPCCATICGLLHWPQYGPIVYRLGHQVFILARGVRLSLGSPNKERHLWWRFLFGYSISVKFLLRASEASGQGSSITRNTRRYSYRACDDGICAKAPYSPWGHQIKNVTNNGDVLYLRIRSNTSRIDHYHK